MKFDSVMAPGKHRPQALRGECTFVPRPDLFQSLSSRTVLVVGPEENQDDGVTVELTSMGLPMRDATELPAIQASPGDIIWTNGRFAARRLKVGGVNHWVLHQSLLLAKVTDMSDSIPVPLGKNIITKPAPKWMQYALTGCSEVQSDGYGLIKIADSVDGEEGVATDNDSKDPSRTTYEEVIAKGPDNDSDYSIGDLVAVTKQRTATNITVRGNRMCLCPPNNVAGRIMLAKDRPEWTK